MKAVIAGGTGLLGRALGRSLAADGWEVVALSRDPGRTRVRGDGVRLIGWDGRSTDGRWTAELAGADAVIDMCGASVGMWPWTPGTKRLLRSSRLEPRGAIVRALAGLSPESRPRVLLAASGTDGYVGSDKEPASEDTPVADTFLGTLCRDWEAEALRAESLGVRVVLVRTTAVLAPGAAVVSRLALPVRLGIGGRIGSGQQWFSWVHIDDAVSAMRLALATDGIGGPLNVASPGALHQVEVAQALGRILHRPSFVWTPALAVRLVLGGQSDLVVGSRRVSPARLAGLGMAFTWPGFEAAAQDVLR